MSKKGPYVIVEIYDIAMAQSELAGGHVAIEVAMVLSEAAVCIQSEDIDLDAPNILISPSFNKCN
jgi:hypothetical protein